MREFTVFERTISIDDKIADLYERCKGREITDVTMKYLWHTSQITSDMKESEIERKIEKNMLEELTVYTELPDIYRELKEEREFEI